MARRPTLGGVSIDPSVAVALIQSGTQAASAVSSAVKENRAAKAHAEAAKKAKARKKKNPPPAPTPAPVPEPVQAPASGFPWVVALLVGTGVGAAYLLAKPATSAPQSPPSRERISHANR